MTCNDVTLLLAFVIGLMAGIGAALLYAIVARIK